MLGIRKACCCSADSHLLWNSCLKLHKISREDGSLGHSLLVSVVLGKSALRLRFQFLRSVLAKNPSHFYQLPTTTPNDIFICAHYLCFLHQWDALFLKTQKLWLIDHTVRYLKSGIRAMHCHTGSSYPMIWLLCWLSRQAWAELGCRRASNLGRHSRAVHCPEAPN